MNTARIKTENLAALRESLPVLQRQVLSGLAAAGPLTTRDLAAHLRLDVLTVRPRVTELQELGAVRLVGRIKHEGVYAAVSPEEYRAWQASQCAADGQLQML